MTQIPGRLRRATALADCPPQEQHSTYIHVQKGILHGRHFESLSYFSYRRTNRQYFSGGKRVVYQPARRQQIDFPLRKAFEHDALSPQFPRRLADCRRHSACGAVTESI